MILTNANYYSQEANKEYMSVSQYKSFMNCEAQAMAELNCRWETPRTTALLVGSYVDAWFEGSLDIFKRENPEIFKKDGGLKCDYIKAEEIIYRVQQDNLFMEYMSGQKQAIFVGELFGAKWKIKIDSLLPDRIVDLKVVRSFERIMGISFITYWGYDTQMAIYSAIHGKDYPTYIAAVSKQNPPDIDLLHIPSYRRQECLKEVEQNLPRILAVKNGDVEPEGCGVCPYCRSIKQIKEPIDYELTGFNNKERRAMKGDIR